MDYLVRLLVTGQLQQSPAFSNTFSLGSIPGTPVLHSTNKSDYWESQIHLGQLNTDQFSLSVQPPGIRGAIRGHEADMGQQEGKEYQQLPPHF